jgi:hypothetical protein
MIFLAKNAAGAQVRESALADFGSVVREPRDPLSRRQPLRLLRDDGEDAVERRVACRRGVDDEHAREIRVDPATEREIQQGRSRHATVEIDLRHAVEFSARVFEREQEKFFGETDL